MSFTLENIGSHVEQVSVWNPAKSISTKKFMYIDLSSVDKDTKTISFKEVQEVLPLSAPSRARQRVAASDVLVSIVRPNLNGVAMVSKKLTGATASTGYCVLRAKVEALNPNYLFYWAQSPMFINDMVRKASGASYPAVSDKIIKQSKIPLPPLEEQKKIAAILDAADALRQKDQQLMDKYTALSQSLFLDMFGDPVTNPMGWDKVRFDSLVAENCPLTYGIVQPGEEFDEGVPIVRPVDLLTRSIPLNALKRIDPSISKKFQRTILSGGEILLSVRGSVGVASFASSELSGANVTRGIVPIWMDMQKMNNEFTFDLLQSVAMQRVIKGLARGATLIQINLKDLREILFICPPITLQNQFAERIQVIESQKQQVQAGLQKSEDLFNSLLQSAFKGELTEQSKAEEF